jgi:hypothetical protein
MSSKLMVLPVLAVFVLGTGGTARAQPSDYRTYFTFSTPVTLPGVTLPAGRYLFRLADPDSSRKVISVLSEDGKTQLAMLHTIPNQLAKAPTDPEVRFLEIAGDMPPPIKGWWYPGNSIGYEFIYSRAQALQLAKVTSEPVLTTSVETKDVATAELSRIDRSGVPTAVRVEQAPAPVQASGRAQQGELAQAPGSATAAAAPDPQADERARRTARTQLPQTASRMPSVVLFGVLMLCAGIGAWYWSGAASRRV